MNPIKFQEIQQENEHFVIRLSEVCSDRNRGNRANLRRWWSKGTRSYAYQILVSLDALTEKDSITPKTLVSVLYAVHSKDVTAGHVAGGPSVGSAALRLGDRKKNEKTGRYEHPFDIHFRRLLAADTMEDLGVQLHHLIKRLVVAKNFVPLDYAQLLGDLRQFKSNPEAVKTRWALAFWQAPAETSTTPDA